VDIVRMPKSKSIAPSSLHPGLVSVCRSEGLEPEALGLRSATVFRSCARRARPLDNGTVAIASLHKLLTTLLVLRKARRSESPHRILFICGRNLPIGRSFP
jgi:hypothetical protein